jgi:hypothetical protein
MNNSYNFGGVYIKSVLYSHYRNLLVHQEKILHLCAKVLKCDFQALWNTFCNWTWTNEFLLTSSLIKETLKCQIKSKEINELIKNKILKIKW